MAGRQHTVNYRAGAQRRRRQSIIITAAIAAAVFLLLFLIIGNILNSRSDADEVPQQGGATTPADTPRPTYVIGAQSLNISTSLTNISSSIRTSADAGATALSMRVKKADGSLLYTSALARELGYQSSTSLPKMQDITSRIAQRSLYSSVYFTTDALKTENAATRTVRLTYEAALVAELSQNGVGDIIVSPAGLTAENFTEILLFSDRVRQIHPSAVIGIAVSDELLSSPDAAAIIDALYSKFDILAFDFCGRSGEEIISAFAEDNKLYYALRYSMRLVLPASLEEETRAQISALLEDKNIKNYQYVN